MEYASGLIKLKPGSEDRLEHWVSTISNRRSEVIETLHHEDVSLETWFQLKIENDSYLLWYMKAKSIEHAQKVFLSSTRKIDLFHLETLQMVAEKAYHTDLLLHFEI